ncbi:lipoyl(octanoyl) transferase [Solimonas aquatica]|uniref:Octanoyltransferase n=1 Tax=Solimonas aquatica TaxID=489703 RepID=A0A1H9FV86_9GAMM|nr:lipoyl(octanoyl) transferase LipB [Solimonas aquatica]SEQ41825.1 lipoyl(octanoyl) transferase [Solimonas aquatica]
MSERPDTPLLPLEIRRYGLLDYQDSLARMRSYTDARSRESSDELWLLQHPRVFTQGQAGKAEHLLLPGDIPVVQSDRGGQVTYHGPGQLVVYFLLDLHRLGYGIRSLVTNIEQSVVDLLAGLGIAGYADPKAPGIYVDDARGQRMKIGSLGLRVRRGCTYHGLSLNVAMDLEPFSRINPCGYAGLRMTQLSELGGPADVQSAGEALLPHLLRRLGPYRR